MLQKLDTHSMLWLSTNNIPLHLSALLSLSVQHEQRCKCDVRAVGSTKDKHTWAYRKVRENKMAIRGPQHRICAGLIHFQCHRGENVSIFFFFSAHGDSHQSVELFFLFHFEVGKAKSIARGWVSLLRAKRTRCFLLPGDRRTLRRAPEEWHGTGFGAA